MAVAREQVVHLLQRTEFVARPERVTALCAKASLAAAVDDVLAVPTAPVAIPTSLLTHVDGAGNWPQYQAAVQWWFERMARTSPRPVQEKMAMFWHGHFCSDWGKVFDTRAMMLQNQLFRDTGTTGNVRTLTRAMAVQPAMLAYLDNGSSTKSSPNQNFARELLELFLLGVGNYSEAEVQAHTRAWTGHNLDGNRNYVFRAAEHDAGSKTLFGQTAAFDGPGVVDLLLGPLGRITTGPLRGAETRRIVARHLSKKLWEAFAHEAPSAALVNVLGDVLVAAGFAIKPWVRAMLLRPEFYADASRTGLVRTPTEYITAVLYHTKLPASVVHPEWSADAMGQAMFRPPNVSGWRPNAYWVNSSAVAARASFAEHVRWTLLAGRDRTPPAPLVLRAGTWTYAALDAMPPSQLIDTLAAAFGLALDPATRSNLITWASHEVNQWGGIDWWRTPNAVLLMMLVPEQLAG